MTDYDDYENNLAFPPTTDSPQEKIEQLTKQLDVKEAMIKNYTAEIETQRQQLAIAIAALELYALEKMYLRAKDGTEYELANTGYCRAKEALEQIKELEK